MYRGRSKILPIIIMVLVAVVAIIAMVSIGRALLNRGGTTQVADDSVSRALLTAEADRSVRMTVRGPIVADEDFRSYEIEISPIGRRMTTYRGYQNESIETIRLSNSVAAYTEFINALSLANFTSQVSAIDDNESVEGVCSTGRLYTFELLQAQSIVNQSWTSSCRGLPGSFRGEAVLIRNLFQAQIPDNRELLRDLDI